MTTQCPTNIPRFSEKAFRRYEPVLREISLVCPHKPVTFTPPNGSLNTHVARLRDACNSLLANEFSTDINLANLREAWSRTIVKHDGSQILIGSADQLKSSANQTQLQVQQHFSGLTVDQPPLDVFEAFCILLSHDVLNKASIKFTNIPVELKNLDFEEKYPNVIFDYLDPDTLVLI